MGYIDEITTDIIKKLNADKEEIVKSRLVEAGIELDYEKEKSKRFKSLVVEINSMNSETYWYNDGTEEGLRIVTFEFPAQEMSGRGIEPTSLNVSMKYY